MENVEDLTKAEWKESGEMLQTPALDKQAALEHDIHMLGPNWEVKQPQDRIDTTPDREPSQRRWSAPSCPVTSTSSQHRSTLLECVNQLRALQKDLCVIHSQMLDLWCNSHLTHLLCMG